MSSLLLSIAAVGTFSLACVNFSSSATPGTVLPREVILPLTAVVQHFHDITRETSTGRNLTATGDPTASRMVVYAIDADSKKVTITVDQYRSSRDASSAYRQAVQKSQSVPGFKLIPVANLGKRTFAGTVTIDAETHIGLGLLDDKLIVGATLAGYDATPDNTAKLVALARMQAASARKAARRNGRR